MLPNRETRLCSYRYDPLDRLVDCTPSAQSPTRRFYLKDRLATEIQDAVQRSIMQHEDQLLAQQQRQSGAVEARLLATDQQRSVLNVLDVARPHSMVYTPYGHHTAGNGLLSLLGFNGERPDPVTGCYLLGNGYRAFNPVLMRFNSPDSWSPFGEGGLNGYAYCVGDPVNRTDPTGHSNIFLRAFKGIMNRLGRTPSHARNIAKQSAEPISNTTSTYLKRTPKINTIGQGQTPKSESTMPFGAHSERPHSPTGTSNTLQALKSTYEPIPKSLPPSIVRVENTLDGGITVVPVSNEAMENIRLVARTNPYTSPAKASAIVRGLAGLPDLPLGQRYLFPNVRHS